MAIKNLAFFILLVFLSSCSSSKDMTKLKTLYELFKDPNYQKQDRKLVWDDIKDINYPLIEVRTNGVLYRALMLPLSTRNGFRNYSSGSGQSLTLEGSLITKTNGFNLELISVVTEKNSPLVVQTKIDQWHKKETRKYIFLTPLNSSVTSKFICHIEFVEIEKKEILEHEMILNKFIENCENNDQKFTNLYWVDKEGFIWISKQWIGNPNIFAEL